MNRLKEKYQQTVRPALQTEFNHDNPLAAARITKVTVNMGVTRPVEASEREKVGENVVKQFAVITGQHPQVTKAKKAVADFKLHQGDPLGVMVTLRGEKMWEFLDKLVSITLPRVKDFRGISKQAFDGQGNYSLGLEEQEINRLNKANESILLLELERVKLVRTLSFIQGTLLNALRALIMFIMLYLMFNGELSLGEFFTW